MRAGSRLWCCVTAVALSLALASSASAASRTKRRSTRSSPTTSTPDSEATPEAKAPGTTESATAATAPVTAPAPAATAPQLARSTTTGASALTAGSAQEQTAAAPLKYGVSVGAGPAIPLSGGDIGLEFVARGLVSIPVKTSEKASLWFVLPLRVNTGSTPSTPTSVIDPFTGQMISVPSGPSATMLALALVPTIQGSGVIAPRLRGYAGVGAGVAHARRTTDETFKGPVTLTATEGEFDLISGVEYGLDDRFSFILEPVGARLFTYPLRLTWTALLGVSAKI